MKGGGEQKLKYSFITRIGTQQRSQTRASMSFNMHGSTIKPW